LVSTSILCKRKAQAYAKAQRSAGKERRETFGTRQRLLLNANANETTMNQSVGSIELIRLQ
jgi:hypothetical protein